MRKTLELRTVRISGVRGRPTEGEFLDALRQQAGGRRRYQRSTANIIGGFRPLVRRKR